MTHYDVAIVGGYAAGFNAAAAINTHRRDARVALIDAEDQLPYKRTKVSKSFVNGLAPDQFRLGDRSWYENSAVDLLTGTRVAAIEPENRRLQFTDGRSIAWNALVLAVGTRPRRPPFAPQIADRLHYPVSATAVERLYRAAQSAETALVVGMGVLGVEVVDQLQRMGKQVTFVGRGPVVMPRELNADACSHMEQILRDGGVELIFDEEVAAIEHDGDRLAVTFASSGVTRRFDLVVYGTGVEPNLDLAVAAGLETDRGIVVDRQLRTSHPAILAAGDVAQHPDRSVTHLWRHAEQQGHIAGLNAVGGTEPYRLVPFRVKCEIFDSYFFSIGRPDSDDLAAYDVVRSTDGERYLCAYYRNGELDGLVMIGDKARRTQYLQAVVERWPQQRFEAEFA